MVFYNDGGYVPGFDLCHHFIIGGAVKGHTGKAIICPYFGVGKAVSLGIFSQYMLLRRDLSRFFSSKEYDFIITLPFLS